jgi:hypothetical protein
MKTGGFKVTGIMYNAVPVRNRGNRGLQGSVQCDVIRPTVGVMIRAEKL